MKKADSLPKKPPTFHNTSVVGWGLMSSFPLHADQLDLVHVLCCDHSCCDLLSVAVMSCPEDTVSSLQFLAHVAFLLPLLQWPLGLEEGV